MQTISATYRVTTPMFLGGAEQQAELRLPSFKGVLRFWWRAMAWERIKDASRLRDEEAALFGSSDERVGQSKVLMRLASMAPQPDVLTPTTVLEENGRSVGMGCGYLAYGVMIGFGQRAGELTRACLRPTFTFTVAMVLKPTIVPVQKQEIEKALRALGVFGGLGSKSRKGYGSLTLLSLKVDDKETWTTPTNTGELREAISTILGPSHLQAGQAGGSSPSDLPEWTAFSPASRIILVPTDNQTRTPLALLDKIGREMVRYRSWGRNGKVLGGEQREEVFKPDHDLMVVQRHPRNAHPKRIAFGLPHNYGKKEQHKEVEPESFDRRASPLFIHVHQAAQNHPSIAVLTFLPSHFLPAGQSKISVGGASVELNTTNLWEPVETFLERMLNKTLEPHHRKESFGSATEVTHG